MTVTGGAGFLGRVVVRAFTSRSADQSVGPCSCDYDLRTKEGIDRALADGGPQMVIQLAAVVGAIGANCADPGRFFHENAIMGIQLIEQVRLVGVAKFVAVGTFLSYPKFTPVPHEDDLWNGYPEETNAPYGLAKKMLLVQSQAYCAQYGFNADCLIPVNLYAPATSSTRLAPMSSWRSSRRAWTRASLARITWRCRVRAPRRASSTTWMTLREGIVLAAQKYDGAEPTNLGSGREITIRELVGMIVETGSMGEVRWDPTKPDGQPRRALDTGRARQLLGFTAGVPFLEGLKCAAASYRRWTYNPSTAG